MANLPRIKELEAEYASVPFPGLPSLKWPVGFTVFGVVGIIVGFAMIGQQGSPGILGVVMYLVWTVVSARWVKSRLRKRDEVEAIRKKSALRVDAVVAEVASLL
jgi:hypothetical protein